MEILGLLPVENLKGDSDEDTELLRGMADDSRRFLKQFDWCNGIAELYFGVGIGGIVAVFLARVHPATEQVDEWLWVIVGDLPPAYLVTDAAPKPVTALRIYIEEMRQWVTATLRGEPLDEVIPVSVPSTPENANALRSRLDFIERELIPWLES